MSGTWCLLGVLVLATQVGLGAQPTPESRSEPGTRTPRIVARFTLFPEMSVPPPRALVELEARNERLFHSAGDPDSLFTFGGPTPHGKLRLKAAFEVNDIVLKAIAPDLRIDPASTRPRSGGDYQALDAGGRPYQLRLGARLVW